MIPMGLSVAFAVDVAGPVTADQHNAHLHALACRASNRAHFAPLSVD